MLGKPEATEVGSLLLAQGYRPGVHTECLLGTMSIPDLRLPRKDAANPWSVIAATIFIIRYSDIGSVVRPCGIGNSCRVIRHNSE